MPRWLHDENKSLNINIKQKVSIHNFFADGFHSFNSFRALILSEKTSGLTISEYPIRQHVLKDCIVQVFVVAPLISHDL